MKPFKEFFIDFESNTFLEYAHNTVFGAAQSIKAHNGKGGGLGVGLDAKIPHIVGDRQEEIRPGTYIRGCKQFNDILAKIGCDFEYGKKLENYKNSGNDCVMNRDMVGNDIIVIIKGIQKIK